MAGGSGLIGNGRWEMGARIARHDEVRGGALGAKSSFEEHASCLWRQECF